MTVLTFKLQSILNALFPQEDTCSPNLILAHNSCKRSSVLVEIGLREHKLLLTNEQKNKVLENFNITIINNNIHYLRRVFSGSSAVVGFSVSKISAVCSLYISKCCT